jgi:alpha-1,3-mannosyltransferase
MKIIHVVRQFSPSIGGMENFVYFLALEQLSRNNDVLVVTLDRVFKTNERLAQRETIAGISVIRIPFWGSKRYPIAPLVIKFISDADIINIHSIDFFVDFLVLLKPFHGKKIVLHTLGGYFHTNFLFLLKKIIFNTITRITLNGCDAIIAISSNDVNLFSKINKRIILINGGVNIQTYTQIVKKIIYGSILFIGRLDVHKRIDNLFYILKRLLIWGNNVQLKIVGPDEREVKPDLEKLARSLNIQKNVIFLNELSDVDLKKELSTAHLFVSASQYESFGISAIEAMASRTLCILNDIPSFKEFIDNGRNGFVAHFNDIDNTASIIEKALKLDDREYTAITEVAAMYTQQYSWDKVAQRIDEVYRKALS